MFVFDSITVDNSGNVTVKHVLKVENPVTHQMQVLDKHSQSWPAGTPVLIDPNDKQIKTVAEVLGEHAHLYPNG